MLRVLGLIALLCLGAFGLARGNMILVPPPAAATYTGPGDVTAFTAWWGLRCYDAAVATGTTKVVNVRAASGPNSGSTQDINCLSNGKFDAASATTFAGTDATCTGSSISGTTLTVGTCTYAGVETQLTAGDEITGTGVTVGTWVVSGTCTSPSGTCTVNISQTVASTTITALGALFVTKMYDQTAGNACTAASCDLVQATQANQPVLLITCRQLTSLPCLVSRNATTTQVASANNFTPNAAKIVSYSWVGNRSTGTGATVIVNENGTNGTGFSTANLVKVFGSSGSVTATATDVTWHAVQCSANTTSSLCNVDGADGSTGSVTDNSTAGKPFGFAGASSTTSNVSEGGFADNVAWSSTVRGNLHTNQSAFYGTP